MNDLVKQLKEFREGLVAEYYQLEQEIAQKIARKREIQEALYSLNGHRLEEEPGLQGRVLGFIQISPSGVRRADIVEGIDYDGNLKYLSNVLGTLKDRGLIRREGNKIGAVWYPVTNDE